ncbi:DUF1194 domain-containing protein [Salinarimonas ramus]|uniref:DUF1194 domain-containing protein n=1 Tax=Salinarimonas ramus TaxID=690164 RepID=A0A917Q8D3_9HYPH|nr:DUF1194 domain-containing protein [Salinarimonas ramus]GGK35955.1 hypothetical protein GCM10011322_23670 [Salinarimonas ramus]
MTRTIAATLRATAFLLAVSMLPGQPARAQGTAADPTYVDLELVFAADGSGSIDDDELYFQRRSWGEALASEDVLSAISQGMLGSIAVAYVEWGGPSSQVLVVDWRVIDGPQSARAFADELMAAPRGAFGWNSISNAIDFSVRLVEENAIEGTRRIIDVTADSGNRGGRQLAAARADALAAGFTINGLAIARPGGRPGLAGGMTLEVYFARELIGGPGAFVEIADERRPFEVAARRKLLTEIAGGPEAVRRFARSSE